MERTNTRVSPSLFQLTPVRRLPSQYQPLLHRFDAKGVLSVRLNFDATVGIGMFAQAVAVFDFKGKHFWVETLASTPLSR